MHDLTLAAVGDLWNRGLSIIPVHFRGKRPACKWKEFQDRRPTFKELEDWFATGADLNVGIVTGAVSGIVVIDCDSAEGIAWADVHLPGTPMITRTPKGEHRFYRHPGQPVRNKVRLDTGETTIAIDVRGDGGYVVGPGSVHETGAVYRKAGEWPPVEELPEFDPAWLESEHNTRTSQTSTAKQTARTGGENPSRSLRTIVAEGARNDSLFREACRLRRLGWSETEIRQSLLVVNRERCRPPLETSEIESLAKSAAAHKVAPDTFPLTDTGNAEFFASVAGGLVRYDHGRRAWFEFNGQHWVRDPTEHVDHLALMAIRARQTAALKISDKDTRRKRLDHALRSESRSRRDSMVQLARKIPALAVTGDDWDSEPLLLGVRNGVLDLGRGRLRDGRPEDNITKVALVDYDPSAQCPRWDRFTAEIFADHPDLIPYMQRVAGYALTGETTEQVFWILWGDGANGKSTLMECLMNSVLGQDYSWTMPFPSSGWTNAMSEYQKASLVGQRLVAASEVTHGGQLNEELIKSLTGGDTINARHPYGRPFQFVPAAKIFLRVNDKPVIRDESHGMWRRVKLVPFTQTFSVDTTLAETLAKEAVGILAWAVNGCLEWQREGLQHPGAVEEATKEYRNESDTVARFVQECCVVGDSCKAGAQELFKQYQTWCTDSDVAEADRLSQKVFGTRLRQKFRFKDGRTVTYFGIGLRHEGPAM